MDEERHLDFCRSKHGGELSKEEAGKKWMDLMQDPEVVKDDNGFFGAPRASIRVHEARDYHNLMANPDDEQSLDEVRDRDPLQTPSKRSAPNDVVETGSSLKKQKSKEKIHEDKNEKKEKHDKKEKPDKKERHDKRDDKKKKRSRSQSFDKGRKEKADKDSRKKKRSNLNCVPGEGQE